MENIDSLVEVRAAFFRKDFVVSRKWLEDEFAMFSVDDIDKVTVEIKPQQPLDDDDDMLKELLPNDLDTKFTEDAIGFSFRTISEGRLGWRGTHGYGSGVDFGIETSDWDGVAGLWTEELIRDAHAMRDEILARYPKDKDWDQGMPKEGLPPELRWIAAVDYWTSGDGVWEDYDSGSNYLGRVKLQDVAKIIVAEEVKDAV